MNRTEQPDVLGMTLEEALRLTGQQPVILRTADPRAPGGRGTERVIRIRGNEWTVAGFLDGDPKES